MKEDKLKFPFLAKIPRQKNDGSVFLDKVLVTKANYMSQSIHFTTMWGVSDVDFFPSSEYLKILYRELL